jgi:hypothetical protein
MTRIVRDVDASVLAAIGDDHTKPIHLVKLEFAGPTFYYLSTEDTIVFDTNTYVGGLTNVSQVSWTIDGSQHCSIEIYNEEDFAADIVFGNVFAGATATVWLTHRKHDNTLATPVLYAVGSCDDIELSPESATFVITALQLRTRFVPNRYFTVAEGFNWLPPENTVIIWNGAKYLLEGAVSG